MSESEHAGEMHDDRTLEHTRELVGRMNNGAKIRIPMSSGIAGFVARTATMKNVADVYTDKVSERSCHTKFH